MLLSKMDKYTKIFLRQNGRPNIQNKISVAETESQIVKIFCFGLIFRLSVDHCYFNHVGRLCPPHYYLLPHPPDFQTFLHACKRWAQFLRDTQVFSDWSTSLFGYFYQCFQNVNIRVQYQSVIWRKITYLGIRPVKDFFL